MFTDEKSGVKIYADLDCSVSHGTMRSCDLIPRFLDVIKDTPEYAQIMLSINGANWNLCVITDAGASETMNDGSRTTLVCSSTNLCGMY